MGKKGKKRKEKITGTPDVVKFKGTRDFQTLKEAVQVQEALPFVQSDMLDEPAWRKVARFLNILDLLGQWACNGDKSLQNNKHYRFKYHHKFGLPAPQYFPSGYTRGIVEAARNLCDQPFISFNGKEYAFDENLRSEADIFLRQIDVFLTGVAQTIELALKDDFTNGGLKQFKGTLGQKLSDNDNDWIRFENAYLVRMHEIHTEVFAPIEILVNLENKLSAAEMRGSIQEKQDLENLLVGKLEEFINEVYPDTKQSTFCEDVIEMAEAAVFYSSKCSPEGLNLCKHLIKAYLELRIYITNIRVDRLLPDLHDNKAFCRLLQQFHKSVLAASATLDKMSRLPRLIECKTEGWMTKALLEPEILEMNDPAVKAAENRFAIPGLN